MAAAATARAFGSSHAVCQCCQGRPLPGAHYIPGPHQPPGVTQPQVLARNQPPTVTFVPLVSTELFRPFTPAGVVWVEGL